MRPAIAGNTQSCQVVDAIGLEIEQLLLDASAGMRDGVRVVQALDQPGTISSPLQSWSIGTPVSRLATRTDSTSGL